MTCEWCGRRSRAEEAVLTCRREFFAGAQLRLFDDKGHCILTQTFTDADIDAGAIDAHLARQTDLRAAVILTAEGRTIPVSDACHTFAGGSTFRVAFDWRVNDR